MAVPDPERVSALQGARLEADPEAEPLQTAQELWLISVKQRSEPAPVSSACSAAVAVSWHGVLLGVRLGS